MCLRTNKGIFRRRGVILLAAHLLGSCLSFFGTATLRWVFWLNEMQSQLATGWGFYCLLPGLDIRRVAEYVYLTLWDFFFSTCFCNKWHGTFDLRKDLSCRYKLLLLSKMFFTWLHLCSHVCLDVANYMTQDWVLKWVFASQSWCLVLVLWLDWLPMRWTIISVIKSS